MNISLVKLRPWLIRWMYAISAIHFIVGVVMAYAASFNDFESYHRAVLENFWLSQIPTAAFSLHIWWLSLFGATLQNLAIFMGLLTYLGDRYRNPIVWGWTIVGLVIWAPQDIVISLSRNVWMHLWIDVGMLLLMLPVLALLWLCDRKKS